MHQQSVILLVVGLAVACSGLDLSHASKRSTELEPRIVSFISDLYAQVIYPPLNHVVTNMALLGAQILAGISQTGIPAPNGRMVHPSEEELRGFFSGLWNDALKPPLADALSNVALMAAQVLAGVGMNGVNLGIGKRDLTEAEMRGFLDALNQAVNDVYTNVIQKPLESALSGGALMLAQMLAGIGVNGVNLGIGKRDLTEAEMRGFLDALNQAVNDVYTNVIQKPLESALAGGALMLAQMLAGVGVNGINLGIGKRDLSEAEMRGFLDALNQAVNDVYTNVIQKPLESALAGGALMLAQMLAGVGVNGVNLGIGKRDLSEAEMRGFLDALNQAVNDVYTNVIQKPLENALAGGALMLAQMLAGIGVNGVNLGIGKRDLSEAEMRGFLDALNQAVNDVYTNVIQKPLESALSGGALMLAQMLAGIGVNGVNLGIGKRDLTEAEMRGFLDALNQAVNDVYTNVIQKPLENALAGGALMLAQMLAGVGVNGINLGIGKRDLTEAEMRGFLDALNQAVNDVYTNVIQKPLESALSGGALMLAQMLAGIGVNGVNLGLGKREAIDLAGREEELRGIFTTVGGTVLNGLAGVWNNVLQVPLENFVQNSAMTAAGWLANLSSTVGKRSAEARGPVFSGLLDHASGLYADQVKPILESAINNAALQLAGVLANFSQNGFGRR